MNEIGIDITKQESKTLDRYLTESFDEVLPYATRRTMRARFPRTDVTAGIGCSQIPPEFPDRSMIGLLHFERHETRFRRELRQRC